MNKTLDQMKEGIKKRHEWETTHPIKAFPGKIFDFFRYTLPRTVGEKKDEVVFGFQRMFRGYDNRMVWGYSYENAKQTLSVLKALDANKSGSPWTHDPGNVIGIEDTEENWHKRWNEAMRLMILGFESFLAEDEVYILDENGEYDHDASEIERERLRSEWEVGATLYIANYGGLWD